MTLNICWLRVAGFAGAAGTDTSKERDVIALLLKVSLVREDNKDLLYPTITIKHCLTCTHGL